MHRADPRCSLAGHALLDRRNRSAFGSKADPTYALQDTTGLWPVHLDLAGRVRARVADEPDSIRGDDGLDDISGEREVGRAHLARRDRALAQVRAVRVEQAVALHADDASRPDADRLRRGL